MSGDERVSLGTFVQVLSHVHSDDHGGAYFVSHAALLDAEMRVVTKSPTLANLLAADTVRRILASDRAVVPSSGLRRKPSRSADFIIIDDPYPEPTTMPQEPVFPALDACLATCASELREAADLPPDPTQSWHGALRALRERLATSARLHPYVGRLMVGTAERMRLSGELGMEHARLPPVRGLCVAVDGAAALLLMEDGSHERHGLVRLRLAPTEIGEATIALNRVAGDAGRG